jgi:hypothetical protein
MTGRGEALVDGRGFATHAGQFGGHAPRICFSTHAVTVPYCAMVTPLVQAKGLRGSLGDEVDRGEGTEARGELAPRNRYSLQRGQSI